MNHTSSTARAQLAPPAPALRAHIPGLLLLTAIASLAANPIYAQAQTQAPTGSADAPAPSVPVAVTGTPRYSAQELERAFSFMDKNHDRKVSRDEASNFRGVSKYFDRADTDKDNHLSPEEFEQAMNRP